MNRCYCCILDLHAHAIYSDVNSFYTEGVLFGNTVDHFQRSWIYYSFSTQIWSFEPDLEADLEAAREPDSRNEENHVCGC